MSKYLNRSSPLRTFSQIPADAITNLPTIESCGINTNTSTTGKNTWGLFGSINEVDEIEN